LVRRIKPKDLAKGKREGGRGRHGDERLARKYDFLEQERKSHGSGPEKRKKN